MADIVSFPIRASSNLKPEDADIDLINRLAWVSQELQAVQQGILATDLAEGEKLSATEAILTAVRSLHRTACAMQASIAGKIASGQEP